MRLDKIKLAGFKSFVDPTTVALPGNLIGVVGPNGCGKSNVIDAVRWVMGESSAKMLRGESMADVIFNGSSGRKPVGTATIELVFDNSDATVTGALARFSEISVKRQVSRDGQSAYFMNGARCRRRDIQDLFLGTGLGPRSYAIIEQGMISRFIEARPDDLRLFIEEAAGISRYKERRRETETRMRHTRENLERLTDLREEIAKQLQHLERQAATAARFRALEEEQRRLGDELAALQWHELDQTLTGQDRALGTGEAALEAERTRLRRLETEIEQGRAGYTEASDAFNAVQGRYYAVGAEIARLEQAIRFATENRARQEAELGRLRRELDEAGALAGRDQATLAELTDELARDTPLLAAAEAALAEVRAGLHQAEAELERCQQAWDAAQAEVATPAQAAQRERATINLLEQRLAQDGTRLTRIDEELARLDTDELEQRLTGLDERSDGLDERLHLAADAQAQAGEALRRAEDERRALAARLDAARTELQTTRGRQASLEALQDAALESADTSVADWLDANGLQDAPRLLDLITVAPGYERACEVVLGDALGAPCVADLAPLAAALPTGGLMLVEGLAAGPLADPSAAAPAGRAAGALAAAVSGPAVLGGLLADILVADSLDDALSHHAALTTGDRRRVVTRDGVQLGPGWLRTPADGPLSDGSQAGGTIARAEELKVLQLAAEELEQVIFELTEAQETAALAHHRLEQRRDDAQDSLARLSRERAALDAELGAGRARLEHLRERRATLGGEREELAERRAEARDEIEDARERLHAALDASETADQARAALLAEREALRVTVTRLRADEGRQRDAVAGLHVGIETCRARHAGIVAALGRAGERLGALERRRDELVETLEAAAEPADEQRERLDEHLERQVAVEQELGAARARMEAIDNTVRAAEQQRQQLDSAIAVSSRDLDALRLQRQEVLVRRRTVEEQLIARGADPRAVLSGLAEACADPTAIGRWRTELDAVANRIARLGNINLAAIDEFEEQSARKRELDAQHADLTEALETLEAAIRKIDRETRARFKETFDRVDAGLRELFPRVFGGGNAYLELTGEDLLETGVAIMARPPGKRNSSIHLLSGGEKALTAVALVFAIFQLNPAPFCMLDEVDAPLDDANVGRFCELVRSLSDQVQFIFISHNKVTMEIADHLIGVTMQEPGVSRLVTVDVEAAARMARAG